MAGAADEATEQGGAQQDGSERERALCELIDQLVEALVLTNPTGEVVHGNRAAEVLLGFPSALMCGESLDHLLGAAQQTRGSTTFGLRERGPVLHRSRVALVADGLSLSLIRERDERERQPAVLMEPQYRRWLEASTEAAWGIDTRGVTTFVNASLANLLRYPREEILGLSLASFVDSHDRGALATKLAHCRSGSSESCELPFRRKDGSSLRVRMTLLPLLDRVGQHDGVLALLSDPRARARVDDARSRLATIVESSSDAIISTDLGGIIETWNGGAERLYGYRAEEIVGRSLAVLLPDKHSDDPQEFLARIAVNQSVHQHETTRRRKDGMLVDVAVSMSPVRDERGRIVGASKIVRDLSEQRRTEAQLRRTEEQLLHAQKLEAVGSLAGGVAHDFNNLLSIIQAYAGIALSELNQADPLREDLTEIAKAAARGSELTRRLLAFSRKQILAPQMLELNGAVRGLERMLRRLLGEQILFRLEEGEGVGFVSVDPGQLEQVIINLAVNARDAMPSGGTLTIETSRVQLGAAELAQLPELKPGPYSLMTVRDTGTGIAPALLSRVFEPFFTTKPVGKGSGLGLSTAYGIVRQSEGQITLSSELGRGTEFRVYLPHHEAPEQVATGPVRVTTYRGSETILLVEDDEAVRASMRAVLQRQGYTVLEAGSGDEALRVASAHSGGIALLVTDIVLPGMDGRAVAESLTRARTRLRVLYVSGYAEPAIQRHDKAARYLQKPITPESLGAKVREVLDSPL